MKKDNPKGNRRPYRKEEASAEKKAPHRQRPDDGADRPPRKAPIRKRGASTVQDPERRKQIYRERYVEEVEAPKEEAMPLNKFVAHCGVCGRREAAGLVKEGKIKVNGEVMLQPGYKVQPGDKITYNDKLLSSQKNLVYVLLNKPKNYLTTTDDPKKRRTVMDLVKGVPADRIYPVGRLDRNTTGLLLLTNDGELAQKLSHPKYNIKKVYQVTLNKPLAKADFDAIINGLKLEDGPVMVDALAYLEKKNELGIEIHSGRNRIVRRIFEHLGYVVDKLDRVMYAGLTKKNIPRGKWRLLEPKEVVMLKHFKH